MLIKGIQKMTLLDYPGKIACTIFTGGCNFRCPFCQNGSLVINIDDEKITEEEILAFLAERQGKLDAVCISGGEPCIQKDLISFCKKVKTLGYLIKLDTNGSFPNALKELVEKKLIDYVAMDVKNTLEKYNLTAGSKILLENIKESIDFLKKSNITHEFRTTVVKEFHDLNDLVDIANLVSPSKLYLQQFRDSEDVIMKNLHSYDSDEMKNMFKECQSKCPNIFLRGV